MLDSGITWLEDQIELVRARQAVGEMTSVDAHDRIVALERELKRAKDAKIMVQAFARL